MNILAFDCGATSGRGVLATFEGSSFKMEEVYRFPSEMVRRDGQMYWDVRAMFRHFATCLKELGTKGIRLDSIGIDTWGVDFGCVGPDGDLPAGDHPGQLCGRHPLRSAA